jgi:hypothetical protein
MSIEPPRTPVIAAWKAPSELSAKILISSAPFVFCLQQFTEFLTGNRLCIAAWRFRRKTQGGGLRRTRNARHEADCHQRRKQYFLQNHFTSPI